jgi:hypothetical protein
MKNNSYKQLLTKYSKNNKIELLLGYTNDEEQLLLKFNIETFDIELLIQGNDAEEKIILPTLKFNEIDKLIYMLMLVRKLENIHNYGNNRKDNINEVKEFINSELGIAKKVYKERNPLTEYLDILEELFKLSEIYNLNK